MRQHRIDERADAAAAAFVRRVAPDDDHLPPEDRGSRPWATAVEDPEQRDLVEAAIDLDPALRRERGARHRPVTSRSVTVKARSGRVSKIDGALTQEEYLARSAPPAAPEPVARPVPTLWRGDPRSQDELEEHRQDDDEADVCDDDGSIAYWSPEVDEYELAWVRHGDPKIDDRATWERELGIDAAEEAREAAWAPTMNDQVVPLLERWRTEASKSAQAPMCGNPNGRCDGRAKVKGAGDGDARCGPCHEYRRTHRGVERPARLLNRAARRS